MNITLDHNTTAVIIIGMILFALCWIINKACE